VVAAPLDRVGPLPTARPLYPVRLLGRSGILVNAESKIGHCGRETDGDGDRRSTSDVSGVEDCAALAMSRIVGLNSLCVRVPLAVSRCNRRVRVSKGHSDQNRVPIRCRRWESGAKGLISRSGNVGVRGLLYMADLCLDLARIEGTEKEGKTASYFPYPSAQGLTHVAQSPNSAKTPEVQWLVNWVKGLDTPSVQTQLSSVNNYLFTRVTKPVEKIQETPPSVSIVASPPDVGTT